jgi:5'-nucleotidase
MRRSLVLLSALALACSGSKSPRKLVILHTNDEHSHLIGLGPEVDDFPTPAASGSGIKGGASRRAAVFATERASAKAAGADSITVSAGDNMMGTLVQIAATSLSPDYRIMKALGYDVTTLGNHEFDYGPAGLAAAIDAANLAITGLPTGLPPIVASNIHFSGTGPDDSLAAKYDPLNTDPTKPIHGKYVITTPNGLKIGFIGIMGADAAAVAPAAAPVRFSVAAGSTVDNRIASLAQIFDDVKPAVDSLRRDDKVDLVVALSHGGADPDSAAQSEDRAIAENVAGIDVVVSGHSHTDVRVQLFTNRYSGRQVAVQQAGRFGDTVGRIALTVNGDGTVTFDTAGSALLAVDDKTTPSDTTTNTVVGAAVNALESQNIPGQPFSFLKYTLTQINYTVAQILHTTPAPVPALGGTGGYYNFPMTGLTFDVDNTAKYQETELIDLSADSMLATANLIAPTDVAVEAAGVVRTPALKKGLTGKLGFADLFIAVPLGGSPVSGTPGYPLCRFGIYLVELKAAFEVTAGFAYTGHNDLFVVPAGFKFEYDTKRAPFNPTGDPTNPANGRVTRMWQLKPAALAAGTYDGDANYDLVFDASLDAAHSLPGFPGWAPNAGGNPLRLVRAVASLYIATFATFAGIRLKDPTTGLPVAGNDPTKTILLRPVDAGSTEIKQWEALGGYVHSFANLPAIYNKDDSATVLPRRAICVGANSSNPAGGNCSH